MIYLSTLEKTEDQEQMTELLASVFRPLSIVI